MAALSDQLKKALEARHAAETAKLAQIRRGREISSTAAALAAGAAAAPPAGAADPSPTAPRRYTA